MTKSVLIVDDEGGYLMAMRKLLQDTGFTIETAQTLTEALQMINRLDFKVIISDIRLSNVLSKEGLEILRHAKAANPNTTFVVLTGYGSTEIMEKAYSLGADVYLEKPVSANVLRSILENQSRAQ